ncbi:peptidase, M50 family [Pseudoramibacter alactolyticus ATCC 23263]|jgi:Zn-dependent protease|uniref:Peptidase, M50 family n=1 Tax=Pseudoramibacter alactolyticus ATCC 23263 TaxID=887929 RepID=E6MGC0_9FIRM|nr:site-2 protease family protein [Pseudoramibacter alactolyticus]EFV01660.1 peptidase, M50 family [Pseudoramibacter alactolyticus ATCC 23263]
MFHFSSDYFLNLIFSIPGILIAICFHEAAHGYAAEAMGDDTPKLAGRLTLNPLRHIDPIGLLALVFVRFGWAKPVPVNPDNFKDRRKGMIAVALSGCLTNLLLGFIGMAAYDACLPLNNMILQLILQNIYLYNVMFGIFNLIPIPPLDGSQVLQEFLPYEAQRRYAAFSHYGYWVLLILMFTGVFGAVITPIVSGILNLYGAILNPVFSWILG